MVQLVCVMCNNNSKELSPPYISLEIFFRNFSYSNLIRDICDCVVNLFSALLYAINDLLNAYVDFLLIFIFKLVNYAILWQEKYLDFSLIIHQEQGLPNNSNYITYLEQINELLVV